MKRIYFLSILWAILCQACCAQGNKALKGEIRIISDKGHALVTGASGFNVRIADKVWNYTHPDFQEAVRQLRPGWLRYFSGTMGDAFSAATGLYNIDYIYMMDHQKQYFTGHRFTQVKGPHRISDLYQVLGEVRGKLVITVNGFTETPEMTAALARFVKHNQMEVEVWQFCNEPYFYVPGRNRYWWNDGYDYAVKMKPHADEIRKVFPGAKLALNFTWDGIWGFMKEIHRYQEEKGAYWNVFSKHSYAPHVGGVESFDQACRRVNTKVIEATSPKAMQDIEDYTRQDIPMLITEFGVWNRPVTGIIAAIYNAEYILRQLQHKNTFLIGAHEISNKFYPKENKNQVILDAFKQGKKINTNNIRTGVKPSDEGKALQLLHEALNYTDFTYETLVTNTAEVPGLKDNREPAVYARAFRGTNGRDYLAITNRSGEYHDYELFIDGKPLNAAYRKSYIWSKEAKNRDVKRTNEMIKKREPLKIFPHSVTLIDWKNQRPVTPVATRIYDSKVTARGVSLKWWPGEHLTGYRLIYGKSPDKLEKSVVLPATATAHELTGLAGKRTYYFQIMACNQFGESAPSNQVKLTTDLPERPQIFKVSRRDTTVTVFWQSVENASGYEVHLRSIDGSVNKVEDAKSVFGYRLTGLTFDQPYEVSVIAYNGLGKGKPSEAKTVTCYKHIPLPARNISARENAAGDIVLQWTRQDTIPLPVYFKILRGNAPHDFEVLATGITGNSYIDTTSRDGKNFYTVIAYSDAGEADFYPNIATVIHRDEAAFVSVEKVEKKEDKFLIYVVAENVKRHKNLKAGVTYADISYLNVEESKVTAEMVGANRFKVEIPYVMLKENRSYALKAFVEMKNKMVYSLPPYIKIKK